MFLTKQFGDHLRLLLTSIQLATHNGHEFGPVGRPALAESVSLDVLIHRMLKHPYAKLASHVWRLYPNGLA